MESLIEPNIHPIFVHFTYALMMTSAVSLLIVSFMPAGGWRDTLKSAGDWMLAVGAFAIIATVAAGFQAYYTVAHDAPSHAAMTTHRNWAVPTAIALLLLAGWRYLKRASRPGPAFSLLFLAAAGVLTVTAWWGGKLVYGYGLGVNSLPQAEGPGHSHEHAPGEGHGEEGASDAAHDDSHDHENEADSGHDAGESHSHGADGSPASQDDQPANAAISDEVYPDTPAAVVDAYAAALRASDAGRVRELLAPDVIIAEGGGAERTAEQYAGHHMPADMAFTAAVDFTVKKRDVLASDDMAVVISESQIHGDYKGETVHSRMMETMVLQRVDDRWRIRHIHWSSAPIAGEHEH